MTLNTIKNFLFEKFTLTIRTKMVISFIIIMLAMSYLNMDTISMARQYSKRFDKIIRNIATANTINTSIGDIDGTMEKIVAGTLKFDEGQQYKIVDRAINEMKEIRRYIAPADLMVQAPKVDSIIRTLETTRRDINLMGEQIKNNAKVEQNQLILEQIDEDTDIFKDVVQEYIMVEINESFEINQNMQIKFDYWMFTSVIIMLIIGLFSAIAIWFISGSISKQIKELCDTTVLIANGNFDTRIEKIKNNEISVLGESINSMAEKVKDLLKKIVKEKENIKKSELRVLQAQINPHFLYNTLDTIVWTAEAKNNEQVIEIVKSLSSFFRISLSDGRDWINIKEEIEHIESYLKIQKIRYRDILSFEIEVEEKILARKMLKLILQPLVENALYHGIKYKRSGGIIKVKGMEFEGNKIKFEVRDNGIGIKKDKLEKVIEDIKKDDLPETNEAGGFGLRSIQKRIELYYGKEFGLNIESEFNFGTLITVIFPYNYNEVKD